MTDILGSSKPILRLLLLFFIVYHTGQGILYPPLAAVLKNRQPRTAPEVLDAENGIGGMGIPGNSLDSPAGIPLDMDPALAGIPEPAEFSKPQMLLYSPYEVAKGDTIGEIAQRFGLNTDTLISVNGIKNTRLIQIGQTLRIPNQDGILYTTVKDDTLSALAGKYKTTASAIQTANELFSDSLKVNSSLFIPGGRLEWMSLQEINGDLFIWPASGYISSPYGYRVSPFASTRQFHSGLDIAAPMGAPIRAAMSGRVSIVSYDDSFGNYVVVTHHSGYRTLYAHMSVIRVKSGAYVGTGERIGDVGSTGLSTGPHLHFTVYKNGITVNPRNLMK